MYRQVLSKPSAGINSLHSPFFFTLCSLHSHTEVSAHTWTAVPKPELSPWSGGCFDWGHLWMAQKGRPGWHRPCRIHCQRWPSTAHCIPWKWCCSPMFHIHPHTFSVNRCTLWSCSWDWSHIYRHQSRCASCSWGLPAQEWGYQQEAWPQAHHGCCASQRSSHWMIQWSEARTGTFLWQSGQAELWKREWCNRCDAWFSSWGWGLDPGCCIWPRHT